jgi:hypothetical protein
VANIDNAGKMQATAFWTGPSFGGGWPIAGDINVSRGGSPATGYVFLADGSHYIGFDGNYYQMPTAALNLTGGAIYLGPVPGSANIVYVSSGTMRIDTTLNVASTLNVVSVISLGGATMVPVTLGGAVAWQANSGNGDIVLGGPASSLYMHPNGTVGIKQNYPTLSVFGFTGILCNGVTTNSSKRYKRDIQVIPDALSMVMDPEVEGTHYLYNPPKAVERDVPKYGLIAEPWERIAPDVVTHDEEGLPSSMDYQQVTAILFQAFKEYVTKADTRIVELETQVKELEKKV